ncbi:hypothetical protein CR513_11861, partial [Mucuna pruriens]
MLIEPIHLVIGDPLLGGNLKYWKRNKQNIVARSSVEVEYKSMTLVTCELIWLKQLFKEFQF